MLRLNNLPHMMLVRGRERKKEERKSPNASSLRDDLYQLTQYFHRTSTNHQKKFRRKTFIISQKVLQILIYYMEL